jgi:hypothetical protein
VSAPKVVEDARESPERDSRPRWGWLAVGLAIGVAVTVLVLRAGNPEQGITSTSVVGEETEASSGGMADVVEGFPDGLVTVTRSDGQSLELLIWPLRGELIERTIPVGVSRPPDPVQFDVSGRRIATLLPVPDEIHGVLYAGIPEAAAIIATEVTGYAWHDTDAFQLAYTTFEDDELLLWAVRHNRAEPELVTRSVEILGHVVAWGDWGFAIQDDAQDTVVLFTAGGEIKDTHPGRVLGSDGSGWLAVDDGGVGLLSSGGGVRMLETEALVGDVLAGRFSEDGERLALLGSDLVQVVPVDGDSQPVESDGRPGVPQLAWSSDGRFVVYPAARGLQVLDTVDGETEEILSDRTITGLGILTLGNP